MIHILLVQTGAALGAVPFIGSGVDSLKISPDQRKLMVREIADIYGLSREEKYDLFESLNLDDYNRFEGPITEVVSISGKKAAEYIAEKLNIRSDSRRCLANCFGHSWCQILYKSRSIFCVSKKTW